MNVIGHQQIKDRFSIALAKNHFPSTFLFVGPAGVGKKTFAMEFSKSILCERHEEAELKYCGECESCHLFDANNHPDFEYIEKQKDRAFLQIEQFVGDREHRNRAGLCHHIALTPFRGGRKIAVIEDGDFFNQESANCLLKTLEEPPPNSILIIIGTSEQKQLPTIRSRCQIIRFRSLTNHEIAEILQTFAPDELPQDADSIAKLSSGSLDVLRELRQEGLLEFKAAFLKKLATLEPMNGDFGREMEGFVNQAGKEAAKRRDRIRQLADYAIEFYRATSIRLAGGDLTLHVEALKECVEEAARRWSADPDSAVDCIERCMDVHLQVAANANQTTLIESWLSDLGKLSRGESPYSLLKAELSY